MKPIELGEFGPFTDSPNYPDKMHLAIVLATYCETCDLPLHRDQKSPEPFCPNCVIDEMNAAEGRRALRVALERDSWVQMKKAGIELDPIPFIL